MCIWRELTVNTADFSLYILMYILNTNMMVIWQDMLLLWFVTFQTAYTVSDIGCKGSIGMRPTAYNAASRNLSGISGLFLNANDGSTCSGTVSAWEFCYYVNVMEADFELFKIQAGVWRKQEKEYYLVNNSLADLPIPHPDSSLQFVCRHWSLNSSEMFEVQKGDIVGMHVRNKSNKIHLLGMVASNEQDGGTNIAVNITDITLPVSDSQISITSFSLYLMALIGSISEPPSDFSEPSTDNSPSKNENSNNWYFILAGLSVFILLLFIIIIAVICKLCCIQKSTMGRTPVLIKYANGRLSRIIPVLENTDMCDNNMNGAKNKDSLKTAPPQPTPPAHSNLSPPMFATETQLDQHEATCSCDSNMMNSPPMVYAIAIDDEQQNHNEDKVLVEFQQPLPKNELSCTMRAHSTNDILNSTWTDCSNCDDPKAHMLTSTEYPYVLHTFEVVGKRVQTGSLPNILSECHTSTKTYGDTNVFENKQSHQNSAGYVDAQADSLRLDLDDEPSYSYTDKICNRPKQYIPKRVPVYKNKRNNYNYDDDDADEESPLTWTNTAQYTKKVSNATCTDLHGQVTKSVRGDAVEGQLQTLQVACVKPLQIVSDNEKSMPDEIPRDSSDNTCNDHKYMKLLKSTSFDHDSHMYARIHNTSLIQLESSICDFDTELAHPNEWHKQTEN